MSKDETPSSRGLLSKMVRFVRNPMVNWNEVDSIEAERDSQYSKQVLKDMLERKRRNDFIRRREFDQLRKIRQRDALNPSQRPDEPLARISMFHSTLTSPGERAVTMRKIDEIEAQMSKMWWKGPGAPPSAPGKGGAEPAPSSHAFAPTVPVSLQAPLQPGGGPARRKVGASGLSLAAIQAAKPEEFLQAAVQQPAQPSPPAQPADAKPSPLPPVVSQPEFVHHPDLEEAAIRFANGDSEGAEASLREVLEQQDSEAGPGQFEVWMTLFDLYRATGQQERFDAAALEFAGRFHRSGPLWFSLPEQLGLAALDSEPALQGQQSERVWNCPSQLTAQSVAALHAWLERNQPPWTLVWSRLVSMDEGALPALTDLFLRWADQPVHLVFADAQVLHALLQSHTVSGERDSNPQWWRMRMAALRFMNQPDAFEMVALDYCVTYEVSPPSWQIPKCTYRDSADAERPEENASALAPESGSSAAATSSPVQGTPAQKPWGEPSMLSGHFAGTQTPQGLQGHVEGDAGELLDALASEGDSAATAVVHIDCARLIRVDFAAAGSVLNWAARQQALGHTLRFEQVNRMVAVFFNIIGINEYAAVQPRKD